MPHPVVGVYSLQNVVIRTASNLAISSPPTVTVRLIETHFFANIELFTVFAVLVLNGRVNVACLVCCRT